MKPTIAQCETKTLNINKLHGTLEQLDGRNELGASGGQAET
jgi:hypothetical protein